MQRFVQPNGTVWDVVLGRESWGALYALFIPAGRDRSEPVRQTMLDASGYDAAGVELARMDDDEIARLFEESTPKNT